MEWLSKTFDFVKQPANAVVVLLVSGALLLLPDSWLAGMRLDELLKKWGWVVGIFFLGSSALVIVRSAIWGFEWRRKSSAVRKLRDKIAHTLTNLDVHEKAVLREFILQSRTTIRVPINDPVVATLLGDGILKQVGRIGERTPAAFSRVFPVRLTELAEDLLTDEVKVQVLDLPLEPTPAQREHVYSSRPKFVHEICRYERGLSSLSGW